jgi:uncharacterized protein with HEPN domain
MTNATKKLLLDICESGRSIFRYTAGKSLDEYSVDRQLRRAVEREFEIIGEALVRLERLDQTTAEQITERRQIIAFRNRITHGYDTVDDVVVWGVIQDFLPALLQQATQLLETPIAD